MKTTPRPWMAALSACLGPAAAWAAHAGGQRPADVVFTNGVVYTVDAGNSQAGALAVRDGRITWVGD